MLVLVLDIESSSVSTTLTLVPERGGKPSIIYSGSTSIPYRPHAPTPDYVRSIERALRDAAAGAAEQAHRLRSALPGLDIPAHIDEAHVVLSSPWVITQARSVSASFGREEQLSDSKIGTILATERASLMRSMQPGISLVEEKIFDIELDGSPVREWRGASAQRAEISYAVSLGQEAFIDGARETALQSAHARHVAFHSALLLQHIYLRQMPGTADMSYAIIHVHGELTDIAVIERGACAFFGSYPVGSGSIVRKLASLAEVSPRTAGSSLSLHSGRHLDPSYGLTTVRRVEAIGHEWADGLDKLIAAGEIYGGMPPQALLIADAHAGFFAESIRSEHPDAAIDIIASDRSLIYAEAISMI